MAITSVTGTVIKSSQEAYTYWHNYYYEGNTKGISEEDIKIINEQYKSKLSEWKSCAEQDENDYEISNFNDEDFTVYNSEAQDTDSTEETESENTTTFMPTAKSVETTSGAETTINRSISKTDVNLNKASGIGGVAAQTGLAAARIITFLTDKFISPVVMAPITLAIGILYLATKPNVKEGEALQELKGLMEEHISELAVSEEELNAIYEELAAQTEGAQEQSDNALEEFEKKQILYETLLSTYTALQERVKNGEQLSASEKQLLQEIGVQIEDLGKEVESLQNAMTKIIEKNSEEIESNTGIYEDKASFIEDALSVNDYAASFDEATKKSATLEAVAQGMNAVVGTGTGISLMGRSLPPFIALAALAFSGASMSLAGVVQQTKIKNKVEDEIDVRKQAALSIENTQSAYDNSFSGFLDSESIINEGLPENLESLFNFEIKPFDSNTSANGTEENGEGDSQSDNSSSNNPFGSNSNTTTDTTSNNPFASSGSVNPFASSNSSSQEDTDKWL